MSEYLGNLRYTPDTPNRSKVYSSYSKRIEELLGLNGQRQANLCLRAFRQIFNCACPAIQRGQGSGFLSGGSSGLTACMSEQRRFWRDCVDAEARPNLHCSHRREIPNSLDTAHIVYGNNMSLVTRKPVFGVFEQERLKPACSETQDSYGLEISNITRCYTI